MPKLAAFLGAFGLAGVGAMLLGLAAVWWVDPATDGGAALVWVVGFTVSYALLAVLRKLRSPWRHSAAGTPGAEEPQSSPSAIENSARTDRPEPPPR